jgi:hypothetical protein
MIEVNELKKLTKNDLVEFYNRFISPNSLTRRKLAVYVNPTDLNDELGDRIKVSY